MTQKERDRLVVLKKAKKGLITRLGAEGDKTVINGLKGAPSNRRIVEESRKKKEYSHQTGVSILAYCLMRNHIHLIAVPEEENSLAVCLRRTHGRYSQYSNARRVRSGHLWQDRFYSCAMEESHLWSAIRYVEMNPVRAGLVPSAEEFR